MGLFCHLSGDGTFRQIPAHFRTSHDSARADPTSFRTSHIRCIAYPSLQPRDAHAAPHLWLRVRACDARRYGFVHFCGQSRTSETVSATKA